MAALSGITAVRPTANTVATPSIIYGATISAGQTTYSDTSDSNKQKLADANDTAAKAVVKGIAITPGVLDGYGYIATGGSIILVGTTMAVGTTYAVGQTAGSIVPVSDLTTNDYVTILGTAATTTQLDLHIKVTATLHA